MSNQNRSPGPSVIFSRLLSVCGDVAAGVRTDLCGLVTISWYFRKVVYSIMSVQINQPTGCISLSDLLLVVQIQLNMFRASSCPSSGAYNRPRPTTLLPPRSNGKPEAATAVYKLLMMGKRMPERRWAVFKRQAINLRDWCIWLVDLFESFIINWKLPRVSMDACFCTSSLFLHSPFRKPKWGIFQRGIL